MNDFNYGVIIGVYEGLDNIDAILEGIAAQTVKPSEAIVWVNHNPDKTRDWSELERKCPGIQIIQSNKNHGCFGRFAASYLLNTEYVMVLDDDTVPGSRWAENCRDTFSQKSKCILGARGIRVNHDLTQEVFGFNDNTLEITEVDFVGHSWVFPKNIIHYMLEDNPLFDNNGEDIQFSAKAKISEHIKSYTPPQPANDKNLHGSLHPALGLVPGRLCSLRPQSHYSNRAKIVKHWIDKGWDTIYGN